MELSSSFNTPPPPPPFKVIQAFAPNVGEEPLLYLSVSDISTKVLRGH